LGAISTGNTPGDGGNDFRLDLPRFFRPGTLNTTWDSTVWNSEGATTWTQCVVDFPSGTTGDAAIDFDILVNGVIIESLTLGSAIDQIEFDILVTVFRNDKITIEITDDGGGTTTDIAFCLRYAIPPEPPPGPDPDDLFVWYDGADLATITESGGLVTVWGDKGPDSIDVTATGGLRPGIGGDNLNGLTTMTFNGSQAFQAPGGTTPDLAKWAFLNDETPHLIMCVLKLTATTGNERMPFSNINSVNGIGTFFIDNRADTKVWHVVGNGSGGNEPVSNLSAAGALTPNQWAILAIRSPGGAGGAASRSSIRIDNGSAIANNTQSTSYTSSNPTFALWIGDAPNTNFGWEGSIAELIFANDVDLEASLYDYLAYKWGL